MSPSTVKRLIILAAEARGACVLSVEDASGGAVQAAIVLLDGVDVVVRVKRIGERWEVANEKGEEWWAGDVPDAMTHAVAAAMGDGDACA